MLSLKMKKRNVVAISRPSSVRQLHKDSVPVSPRTIHHSSPQWRFDRESLSMKPPMMATFNKKRGLLVAKKPFLLVASLTICSVGLAYSQGWSSSPISRDDGQTDQVRTEQGANKESLIGNAVAVIPTDITTSATLSE